MLKKGILNKLLVIFFQGISLLILPLIAKYFGNKAYGIWSIIYGIMQMMVPLLILQLDGAFTRFLSGNKSIVVNRNRYFSIVILLLIVILFMVLVGIIFNKNISFFMFASNRYTDFVYITLIWISLRVLITFNKNYFRTFAKFSIDTRLSIAQQVSIIVSIFIISLSNKNLYDFFVLILSMESIILLVSFWLIIKELKFKKIKIYIPKKYFRYALPLIPVMLLSWIINYSDQIMIVHNLSLEDNARYSLYYTFARIPHWIVITPLHYALLPYLSKLSYKGKNKNKVNAILKHSINISFLIISIFVIGLIFFEAEILLYIGNQQILSDSIYLIILISLSVFATAFYQIIYHVLSLTNKTKYLVYIYALGAIVNIVLNYFMIPIFGIIGAAFATLISYILVSFFTWKVSELSFYEVFDKTNLIFIFFMLVISILIKIIVASNCLLLILFFIGIIIIYILFLFKCNNYYYQYILQKVNLK